MKFTEKLKNAKEAFVEEATTGKGAYVIEQIPYIGDYVFCRSGSRLPDEKADRVISAIYGSIMGTMRTVALGAGIAGGFPAGGIAINSMLGGFEGAQTYVYKCKKDVARSIEEVRKILEGNNKTNF
jgi:hypothetical protein